MIQKILSLCMLLHGIILSGYSASPPQGFMDLEHELQGAVLDIRYFGENNFVGSKIDGYHAAKAYLSLEAGKALLRVQYEALSLGLQLKIFDAYRPQSAVDHFVRWAKLPEDTLMKAQYYPDVAKSDLFLLQYIAEKSGHTRGSTIDLTLIEAHTGQELDMGSPFDFFGIISHHGSPLITTEQTSNRELLLQIMIKNGFKAYPEEWWHYTLADEPYPDTYFNFPVK
jgi:D-alanyl-D-alanine dipeptidase